MARKASNNEIKAAMLRVEQSAKQYQKDLNTLARRYHTRSYYGMHAITDTIVNAPNTVCSIKRWVTAGLLHHERVI